MDVESLRPWLACRMSFAEAAALAAHPRFTEAARALYRVKVEAVSDPVLSLLSRDAGHYVAALLAFTLHETEAGPAQGAEAGITLGRLQKACAETGLMSPGRARNMLNYLRHFHLVAQVALRNGQSAARYAPTTRFTMALLRRMRSGLEAIMPIEPAVRVLLDHMDDPDIATAFTRRRGQAVLSGLARAKGHDAPFVRIFNHRLGGGRALALLLSRDAGDGPFAAAPVTWSLDEIVQHCGISRVQARRLVNDALDEGLIRIEGGHLTWLAEARHFIVYGAAFEIASILVSAAMTVRDFPQSFPASAAWQDDAPGAPV